VQLVPSPPDAHPSTVAEIVQAISPTEPRFTFCRFEHEGVAPGLRHTALLFFFTCPSPQPGGTLGLQATRKRMVYPLLKRAVLQVARAEAGLSVDKKFEVEDTAEIDENLVLGELKAPQGDESRGS
jgi:twinfilin